MGFSRLLPGGRVRKVLTRHRVDAGYFFNIEDEGLIALGPGETDAVGVDAGLSSQLLALWIFRGDFGQRGAMGLDRPERLIAIGGK